ncbi:hypothetical protein FKG94_12030 [Exilibacterium tricleocarpae]|uniref:Uncharacterized protein n=1 Tax=Exilibacterium tricleocarpae TaxID=2591008 RepID=A0A545TNG5_9GAMM|nr:DUF6482 family protein [Exilibacterium tricleocarpae]TQV78746.1 hypothetical protein FKG94_12030 [Exilibacterium tricleocarpae]
MTDYQGAQGMKLQVSQLAQISERGVLIIESLDASLYQAFVAVDGCEHLIYGDDGRPVRAFSLGNMRQRLGYHRFLRVVLRQHSAYDEMIGQPVREQSNALEVDISWPAESGFPVPISKSLH